MIPLENIKNGSQFVVTAAGAKDGIHQMSNFTPVVQGDATYLTDDPDHTFCPNGILPDGAVRPVPVAEGLKLEAGMVITVDQFVYHCAKTAGDQKAYQCVHGTVIDPGNSDFKATTGYFYITYADVTRVEPYTPVEPPGPVAPLDTILTIVAGSTTIVSAVVKDGVFTKFEKQIRIGTPGGADVGGVVPGGGVVLGGAGGGATSDVAMEEARWPDAIIDYHMGLYTNIAGKADPSFLLVPSPDPKTNNYWSLGVGGWVLLGFDNGFPVGPGISLRYIEGGDLQHVHVWIAKIDIDPISPVRYLNGSSQTPSNVYAASAQYVERPGRIVSPATWAGAAWRFVGSTKGHESVPIEMDFGAKVEPGIYHYMLIVDSWDPNYSADEFHVGFAPIPKGGPDIKSISVVWSTKPIHFLLLVDGSRSEFSRKDGPEKYHKIICKCVAQALSLSQRDKELTIFFIRGDYDQDTGKIDRALLRVTSIEDIVQRIMDNLDAGWKTAHAETTPLAETVDLAVDFAETLDKAWSPSVIIVSDGIADPKGVYNTPGAVKDNLSEILDQIVKENGDVHNVHKAFMRLRTLGVAHTTRLVGPWLKNNTVHKKITDAYATFKNAKNPESPLLDIVYSLDGDIDHESVYHTDCRLKKEEEGGVHRIKRNAAKRLVRVYDNERNGGFQKCPWKAPGTSGEPEDLGSYSAVLDRDVHETGNVRAMQAAVFEVDRTSPVLCWMKTKKAAVSGDWQVVSGEESLIRYELKDNNVWTPIPKANKP